MRTVALLVLLCVPVRLHAQQPPVPPAPSIDQLLDKIGDLRKQRADLDKQEAATIADLKAQLKALTDKLDKLGLIGPSPPPPAPPAPVDSLRAKLKAAFDGDPAQLDARRGYAKDLAALYRQAATLAADPTVTTSGDLLNRVKAAGTTLVGIDTLKSIRTAVGAELAAVLPTDADLSDDQRKAAAALFAKLAAMLEDIAKSQ